MPVTKEEEKIALEKISQSTGDETEKYARTLEDGADKIINQITEQREEIGKKAEEQIDELNKGLEKEEETKKTEEEKPDEKIEGKKEEAVEDELKVEDTDTVESLTMKLQKSEKRVQDNRAQFNKRGVDIREKDIANKAVVENLNETIGDLRIKIEEKATAKTTEEEKIADKKVKEGLVDLDKQFEIIKNIDPDIAEPIKQIIKSIQDTYSTKITTLESELKNKTESDQKSAQQTADDIHFGKIEKTHSDWETIVDSAEFDAYVESLSPRQKILARADLKTGSAENIIELFDDYKTVAGKDTTITKEEKDTDTETDEKKKKLKAAQNLVNPVLNKAKDIKTEGVKIKYTRTMIQKMSPAEFAKHEPEIDKEMAAGLIPDR